MRDRQHAHFRGRAFDGSLRFGVGEFHDRRGCGGVLARNLGGQYAWFAGNSEERAACGIRGDFLAAGKFHRDIGQQTARGIEHSERGWRTRNRLSAGAQSYAA